jgi:hypothetical protein
VQPAPAAADLGLGALDGLRERLRCVGGEGAERQPLGEPFPGVAGSVADGLARQRAEVVLRTAAARRADDLVALGHEAGAVEVEEPGQQLAAGEIAKCAEEHDHMVVGDRGAVCARHRP